MKNLTSFIIIASSIVVSLAVLNKDLYLGIWVSMAALVLILVEIILLVTDKDRGK